jgi:hypothetical protein
MLPIAAGFSGAGAGAVEQPAMNSTVAITIIDLIMGISCREAVHHGISTRAPGLPEAYHNSPSREAGLIGGCR